MGLDTTHDCWHGSYGAFNRFRDALAEAAGYTIKEYGRGYITVDLDWDRFEQKNFYGEWDSPPEDPLLILIVHSDCEGVISAAHAPFIATRLEQLAPKLSEEGAGHLYNPRAQAMQFATGLREAASKGENVEFW